VAERLSRVEQKLNDLQGLVGALQSFARSNPGALPPQDAGAGAPGTEPPLSQSDLGTRVTALETQIGALTAELEQINQRLNALSAAPVAQAPAPISPSSPPPDRQGDARPPPDAAMAAMATTAGALAQKDYAGAEVAFRQLIESYPKDPLAADAQYWIGESFYRRGQYKAAADAFLKGYKKYKSGDKAPETLLKLGMSLAALGPARLSASSRRNSRKRRRPSATR
jgi:tol-pal system protein YbgF